jgi:diguanylate cyclase (GGDEF)-like protein
MIIVAEPKPLVLIADQSDTCMDDFGHTLMEDFRVKWATHGEEALELAWSNEKPDLILLDVGLPDTNGYTVCERLRKDPRSQDIPVIFLSARTDTMDPEHGYAVGGVDYILKPFDLPVLRTRVRTHIRLKNRTELLEKLVSIDPLTGILNRRGFDQILETEWKRASRGRYSLSVLMIDVDCFKAFNDNCGHEEGDECLRQIAHTLRNSLLRPQDFIARFGGDEFAAVLPVCDPDGARKVAEQLKAAVEQLAIPHPDCPVARHVTISLGLAAVIPGMEGQTRSLVEAADRALYQAKRAGKNLVGGGVIYDGELMRTSQKADAAPEKPAVLIVDDAVFEAQILAEALGDEFNIHIALNGRQGLEAAARRIPDLVLLDVSMPGMDGYEVCRRFKADPELERVPIIFMTFGDRERESYGLSLGAVDFVSKPADFELLRLRVRNHILLSQQFRREHDLVEKLRLALSDVTELQGLLPICAWCHKVRNDQGYWEDIAAYVGHHLGTTWTHGVCPDCQHQLLHDSTG